MHINMDVRESVCAHTHMHMLCMHVRKAGTKEGRQEERKEGRKERAKERNKERRNLHTHVMYTPHMHLPFASGVNDPLLEV